MDQRTDNERRQDAAPGREAKPAVGATRKTQPFLERLRHRRRMLLVVTALLIVALVGVVASLAYYAVATVAALRFARDDT